MKWIIRLSCVFLVSFAVMLSVIGCQCGGGPPEVDTDSATAVTSNSAQLNGILIRTGSANAVLVYLRWGQSEDALNEYTASQKMSSQAYFHHNLSNLTPGTTYYYQALAVDIEMQEDPESYVYADDIRHFTTLMPPPAEPSPTPPPTSSTGTTTPAPESTPPPTPPPTPTPKPTPTNKPIAELHFDENNGIDARDTSGKENHGTLMPTGSEPAWNTESHSGTSALSFDGIDDYVLISNSSSLSPTGSMTIEAWIKTTDTDGGIIVNKGDVASDLYGKGVDSSTLQYGININVDGSLATNFWSPSRSYVNTGER